MASEARPTPVGRCSAAPWRPEGRRNVFRGFKNDESVVVRLRGVDDLQDFVVDAPVGRHRAAAEGGGAAGEVGEAAARLFNDDLQSGEVPRLEVDIDHGLGLSAGYECVAEE